MGEIVMKIPGFLIMDYVINRKALIAVEITINGDQLALFQHHKDAN